MPWIVSAYDFGGTPTTLDLDAIPDDQWRHLRRALRFKVTSFLDPDDPLAPLWFQDVCSDFQSDEPDCRERWFLCGNFGPTPAHALAARGHTGRRDYVRVDYQAAYAALDRGGLLDQVPESL